MLMQLFKENGNNSIEGIDVKHACYGGTFALFTAFDRVTSKYWNGKYCVVISADIAEYAQGPARPSGGCGAVAMYVPEVRCMWFVYTLNEIIALIRIAISLLVKRLTVSKFTCTFPVRL